MSKISESQISSISKFVPLHQYKVQQVFIAEVKQNGSKYKNCGVAISEHMIILAKRGWIFGYNILNGFNILQIDFFDVREKTSVSFGDDEYTYDITGDEHDIMTFARTFIKNYKMISGIIPPSRQCNILIDDSIGISEFTPRLSPTQMFQTLYNANCAFYNSSYSHEVTQFVHNLITTENCVADFSRMPLHLIDDTYSSTIDLKPVFQTLKFLPTIYGIQMKDVGKPDFFFQISDIVKESPNIRLISLEACNVTEGIPEFAYALTQNKNLHLEYLDISDNPFADLTPLSAALAYNQGDLWYLDFSNCGMSNEAVKVAMTSLITNENLWGIIHLDFRGAVVHDDSVKLIIKYLTVVAEHNSSALKFLSFGSISTRLGDVLHTLTKYPQPIEVFYLNGCTFDQSAIERLIVFLQAAQHLQELDLSDTNLKPAEIALIIKGLARNTHISDVTLHLDDLKLNKGNLKIVLDAFSQTKNFSWSVVSFDSNEMGPKDVEEIVKTFSKIPSFIGLSISDNLKKGKASVEAVRSILTLPKLQKLWIRGSEKRYIGVKLSEVISSIKDRGLNLLDISFNHIKDEGMRALMKLIDGNRKLVELMIDGSHPHTPSVLMEFMDLASRSTILRRMKFPAEDVNYLMRRFIPKKDRQAIFTELSYKQRMIQDRLLRNQTMIGLHSDLSEQQIPELDDMLDEMTAESHERICGLNALVHNGSPLAYGLPFPHLKERDNQLENIQQDEDTEMAHEFMIPEVTETCIEQPSETRFMHAKAISIRKGENFMSSIGDAATSSRVSGGHNTSHAPHPRASNMPNANIDVDEV